MSKSVQRQVVLPWGQVARIAFNSINVRFFRSLITMLTLALAIAFVSYMWCGYGILNAFWPNADDYCRHCIAECGYEMSDGVFGSTAKDRWLAILSLVVCVVGIINAQLMAVTERFREIGTFKCLGALDSFIVRIFVLESVYQGLLGGILGSVTGVIISILTLGIEIGSAAFLWWSLPSIIITVAQTSLLAVFLSLVGVIYPALVAARMRPAVALGMEE